MILLGKRGRKHHASDDAAAAATYRTGKRGRPLKRPDNNPLSRSHQQVRSLSTAPQPNVADNVDARPVSEIQVSPFERLPTELVQSIFFLSLETSLANTCRSFNDALSDESIFRTLILFAYFQPEEGDDDDITTWERRAVEEGHFRPAQYRFLDFRERATLQETILGYRWCTKARIDACMPVLCRLAMVQAWHREAHREETGDDAVLLPDLHDESAMRSCYEAYTNPDEDANIDGRLRPWIHSTRSMNARAAVKETSKFTLNISPVLATLTLPPKLLRGSPWTEGSFAFLKLLFGGLLGATGTGDFLQAYTGKEGKNEVTANAVFQGMGSAMLEGRADILQYLLERWETALEQHSEKRVLPQSLFRIALDQGHDRAAKYLSLLFRVQQSLHGEYEESFTAWALQARRQGNALGQWILDKLEAPPGQFIQLPEELETADL
jgi:hypothetical protein